MSEEREPELTPKPDDRAGLYMMIGFAVLMGLVIVLGWLTSPP